MSHYVEYHKFPGGEVCSYENCRERRYYLADGKRWCKKGHEQQGFRQVLEDEDDFNPQGRKTRRKREEKEKIQRVFTGRKATELFLQCYQLVLWKQVKWLVSVKHLPMELETVVRDLWAVRLRAVRGLREGGSGPGSQVEGISSTSEGDKTVTSTYTSEEEFPSGTGKKRKIAKRHSGLPTLIESLGLCYLGMLLIRLPTGLGELSRWVESEELLFLRVIRVVPKEMRDRLPSYYHAALESRSLLGRGDLHRAVLELVIFFKQEFGIVFPPLNAPQILFKHVTSLYLPLDIYMAARRLAKLLKFEFSFPSDLAKHGVAAYPESKIISLVVIATKLSQPFDGVVRVPESVTDPSSLTMDWEGWIKAATTKSTAEGFQRGQEIKVTEKDVFQMSDKKLDNYLDWYQRTWIDDSGDPKLPQQMLDLFETKESSPANPSIIDVEEPLTERLKRIQGSLTWHRPIPAQNEGEDTSDINRPGSFYRYYRSASDLPSNARVFFEKAAESAGLSLEMLVRAVFLIEQQLETLITVEKRRQRASEWGSTDEGDYDEDKEKP